MHSIHWLCALGSSVRSLESPGHVHSILLNVFIFSHEHRICLQNVMVSGTKKDLSTSHMGCGHKKHSRPVPSTNFNGWIFLAGWPEAELCAWCQCQWRAGRRAVCSLLPSNPHSLPTCHVTEPSSFDRKWSHPLPYLEIEVTVPRSTMSCEPQGEFGG